MSLAVLWEKYAYQDFTKKLLKQDFLRVDIGNRQQKDFTEQIQINCVIGSFACFLETQICERS